MSSLSLPAKPEILAIEDDPVLGAHLKDSLQCHGYRVTLADDGARGLLLAREPRFDVILLDVLLPGLGGFSVLSQLREWLHTPVIMMSALGDETHRITGFDNGADDYLPKPFSIEELRVRIEAVLRRVAFERTPPPPAQDGTLHFDDANNTLTVAGQDVGLTRTEFRLLRILHRHAGEVLSKPYLYQQVLHRGFSRHDRALDMHISNIRRKLDHTGIDIGLHVVWGKGYILDREVG